MVLTYGKGEWKHDTLLHCMKKWFEDESIKQLSYSFYSILVHIVNKECEHL